jgi:hypothetical protein
MRSRVAARIATSVLVAALLIPSAGSAGPDAVSHGVTSTLVEHIRFVPFEVYSATGARVVGKYLYLTSWKNLSIYDVSDPQDPQLVSFTPFSETDDEDTVVDPHRYENEDVATNGEILLFTQHGATPFGGGSERLRIYDVSDKTRPVQIANVPEIAEHTMTCIEDCRYAYGSNPGRIVDLADPAHPVVRGNWPTLAGVSGGHDVREVAPGLVAVSSHQAAILDTSDPLNPVKVSVAGAGVHPSHSSWWDGEDRFLLGAQKTTFTVPRCSDVPATSVWDMSDYRSGRYEFVSEYAAKSGWLFDGNPPASALGCSSHWLEASPAFRDGGIFAQAHYEHGVRFFSVSGTGDLTEVGFFTPVGGSVSAVLWITDRILYTIDYTRGIDVLRWTGPLPRRPGATTGVSQLQVAPDGAVTGSASFSGEAAPTVLATDPAGDGPVVPDAAAASGIDLVRAGVWQSNAAWPYLEFTWEVTDLVAPQTGPGTAPEVLRYSWGFTAGGERYLVRAKLSNQVGTTAADDPAGPGTYVGRAFELLGDCETPVAGTDLCRHLAWLDGAFNVTEDVVSIRLPVGAPSAPDIRPGAVLETTEAIADPAPSIAAAYDAPGAVGVTPSLADTTTWSSYTIPAPLVRLGVAPAGTDPGAVSYDLDAIVEDGGSFQGAVGPIPAGWAVFATACFGTRCGEPAMASPAS